MRHVLLFCVCLCAVVTHVMAPKRAGAQAPDTIELPNSAEARCSVGEQSIVFYLEQAPAKNRLTFPRLNNVVHAAFWQPAQSDTTATAPAPNLNHTEYIAGEFLTATELLNLRQTPSEWTIELTPNIEYPAEVVLLLEGEVVYAPDGYTCRPGPDHEIVLPAHHARVEGEKLQFEPLTHKNTVGYWVNANDSASWQFSTGSRAAWDVHVLQGCGAGQGGSRVSFDFGEAQLDYEVEETGHFQNFRWRHVGTVHLETSQDHRLQVSCSELARGAVMDLRQIRLVPVGPSLGGSRSISDVQPDCVPPVIRQGEPRSGQRVEMHRPSDPDGEAYHTLYLPTNWNPRAKFPVLVEFGGNGPYMNVQGDRNSGRVEDTQLGYGLSGNDDFVWLSLPFVNAQGTRNVSRWWGDPPDYSLDATLEYALEAIDDVCENYGGDRERLVLIGFSRGSLACNYLGLHNDEIACLWRGFVCFSHYDGVRSWPYPDSDEASAVDRLKRLKGRPQLIISESSAAAGSQLDDVREFFRRTDQTGDFSFLATDFINHDDDWTLRPSPARRLARQWLRKVLDLPVDDASR